MEAYPLSWPEAYPRHKGGREWSRFKTSFANARDSLIDEIRKMGGKNVVLSSNVTLRRDGLPYAGQPQNIDDPGVAVYFVYKGNQMCFACDRFIKVMDNVQAIRKTIEAIRGIERWGASDMMERAFRGFAELPSPETAGGRAWELVLEMGERTDETDKEWLAEAERQYRILRGKTHPDRGGDEDEFQAVQRAIEFARQILG